MMDSHMGTMDHDKMHWGCCLRPLLGKLLWVVAAFALIAAWLSGSTGAFWGREAMTWYWDALVLGVLALGLRGHGCRHKWCAVCGVKQEMPK